jgi:acetyl esterase/lipase
MHAAPHLSRVILALMLSMLAADALAAVATSEPAGDTMVLWPQGAPGGERVAAREAFVERAPQGPLRDRYAEHITRPTLTFFRPGPAANGVTLLIVPGGGYERVVIDKEGFESAQWFAQRGFACAVLRYRLPADGWAAGADAPIHDIQRAVRLLRSQTHSSPPSAPARVGVIGFSAGGHAVARFITQGSPGYRHVDAIDDEAANVDFAVLMYPVIATTGVSAHGGSARQLLASGIDPAALAGYSPHLHVDSNTPPTLLVHAADDTAVPVENSLLMFEALRKAGVRSELHVFDRGGHGFGMRAIAGKDVATWPQLVENWALLPTPSND